MIQPLTKAQLLAISPNVGARADVFVAPINTTFERFDINTNERRAAFLAQILHESMGLTRMVENLNYTPEALMATFNLPTLVRFTAAMAERYGRTLAHAADQEAIANVAYANRPALGNGPVASGDGWRYRGRGPIQITGKNNYRACGDFLGVDLISFPEKLEQPGLGTLASAWFWDRGNRTGKSLNLLADKGDIAGISKIVNGGTLGLAERLALSGKALQILQGGSK